MPSVHLVMVWLVRGMYARSGGTVHQEFSESSDNCFIAWSLFLSYQSHSGEVLPRSPRETVTLTCAVSLRHSWVTSAAPTAHLLPTPIAASSICQALVFLRPLCLSVSCWVLGVAVHLDPGPQRHSMKLPPSPLPLLFASLIHVRRVSRSASGAWGIEGSRVGRCVWRDVRVSASLWGEVNDQRVRDAYRLRLCVQKR